jgi:1-acyl-sn-glycerol-3-phosphate acyltransferase
MFNNIIKLFLYMNNIKLEINNRIKKFQSIVVCNHISELDPFILYLIFENNNMQYRFISDIRIKNIPIFGMISNYYNTIYIDRTKPKEALEELNKNIDSNDNICIFPEGTLYYNPMIKKSNKICKKLEIKNFKNVLCPKISGFNCIKSIIKPKYITDITLKFIYPDNYPKDFIKKSNEALTIMFLIKNPPSKIICNIKNVKIKKSNKFIIDIFRNKDNELNFII